MRTRCKRRGLAVPEQFVVLGAVALGIMWAVGSVGSSTATRIDTEVNGSAGVLGKQAAAARGSTAGDLGKDNPSKSESNNGLGNGSDGQAPGNAPVNDGEGTSPGNPGNKGGAFN